MTVKERNGESQKESEYNHEVLVDELLNKMKKQPWMFTVFNVNTVIQFSAARKYEFLTNSWIWSLLYYNNLSFSWTYRTNEYIISKFEDFSFRNMLFELPYFIQNIIIAEISEESTKNILRAEMSRFTILCLHHFLTKRPWGDLSTNRHFFPHHSNEFF